MSTEQAARVLAGAGGLETADSVLRDPAAAKRAYRRAAGELHPDAGGSTEGFQRLQEAKRIIDAHHGAA
jgi:curved DNA-binding protein CbpA